MQNEEKSFSFSVQQKNKRRLSKFLLPNINIFIELLIVQDVGAEEHAKQIVLLKQDLKEMQDSHDDIAGIRNTYSIFII